MTFGGPFFKDLTPGVFRRFEFSSSPSRSMVETLSPQNTGRRRSLVYFVASCTSPCWSVAYSFSYRVISATSRSSLCILSVGSCISSISPFISFKLGTHPLLNPLFSSPDSSSSYTDFDEATFGAAYFFTLCRVSCDVSHKNVLTHRHRPFGCP